MLVGGVLEETRRKIFVSKMYSKATMESGVRGDKGKKAVGWVSRTRGPWWSGGKSACRPGTECCRPSRSAYRI